MAGAKGEFPAGPSYAEIAYTVAKALVHKTEDKLAQMGEGNCCALRAWPFGRCTWEYAAVALVGRCL